MNYVKTAILLAVLTGLFGAIGYALGGTGGMVLALVVAAAMNVFSYWNADKMVLRMYKARQVDESSAPELVHMVRRLAQNANMPMPKVFIIDNPQPNAFATGRNPENASVAATTGILKILNRDELEGVMAHELAHVKNRDTLTMTITATIAGAISMLANFALFMGGRRDNAVGLIGTLAIMILAPMAAGLVQMAISRTREYQADKVGAEISGKPIALATALEKISQGARAIDNVAAEQNPGTAHLFIINPLNGQKMDNLFSTHPNPENRIARLYEMATGVQRRRGPWG